MKNSLGLFFLALQIGVLPLFAAVEIPANDPNIQYHGRWDFSDPLAPSHSWPGVYIHARFEGTSIGVRMADNFCYYNIIIDEIPRTVFHPTTNTVTTYMLATGLVDGLHTIRIEKRNETTWTNSPFMALSLMTAKPCSRPSGRWSVASSSSAIPTPAPRGTSTTSRTNWRQTPPSPISPRALAPSPRAISMPII